MENILFGDDDLLKLADFGLAVMLKTPEQKLNDLCGSLLYVRAGCSVVGLCGLWHGS